MHKQMQSNTKDMSQSPKFHKIVMFRFYENAVTDANTQVAEALQYIAYFLLALMLQKKMLRLARFTQRVLQYKFMRIL